MTGSCKVVRVDDSGLRAVRFLSMRRETQHRLMRFLFERQQERSGESRPAPPDPVRTLADLHAAVRLWTRGDLTGAQSAYQRLLHCGDCELGPRAALDLAALLCEQSDRVGARVAYQVAIDSGHRAVRPLALAALDRLAPAA